MKLQKQLLPLKDRTFREVEVQYVPHGERGVVLHVVKCTLQYPMILLPGDTYKVSFNVGINDPTFKDEGIGI